MEYKRFNYILIGLTMIALIVVIGINVRERQSRSPVVKRDFEVGWVFTGKRVQDEAGYGKHELRFNNKGIRGDEVSGPVKMLFLGNSVAMAQEVAEDKTFCSLLGAVNGGQDAYATYQMTRKFERDLMQLQPESLGLIVVAIDIMSYKSSEERIKETVLNNDDLKPFPLLNFTKAISKAKAADLTDADQHYLLQASKQFDEMTWKEWTNNVLKLRDLANGNFFVVLSPPKAQVIAYRDRQNDYWINQHLQEFCANNGIKFIDLLPDLAQYDPQGLYTDHVHYNREGHAIVAKAISNRLRQ